MKKFAVACFAACVAGLGEQTPPKPETVMLTYHAKAGAEAELEQVVAQHWKTGQRLHLLEQTPHMTIRGRESGGKTYFVDIFTWRDEKIPDSAPAEIRNIWAEMNRLVEARDGHPAIEVSQVTLVGR